MQCAGAIIDVYPQDKCGHYLVKGYVEQPESGDSTRTGIVLSISDGAVFDCNGEAFPGSTLTSRILNRWGPSCMQLARPWSMSQLPERHIKDYSALSTIAFAMYRHVLK